MKTRMIFECDKCGKKSSDRDEIMKCEASHLGLTVVEMEEWERLKADVRYKGTIVSTYKNENTDRDFDKAIYRLMEFEKEHGLIG